MRNFNVPHTARWVAVCIGIFAGSLIFQGCGGDDTSQKNDPYAELDKAFPDGRTPLADAAVRAQDKAYMAEITAGAEKFSSLSATLAEYDRTLAHIKEELAKSLSLRMGEQIPETLLEDELAQNPLYQSVLEKRNAAAAEVEAQRLANMETIRNRMAADAKRYDEMLAEADAKAKAAGLPTRAEAEAAQKAAAKTASKEVSATEQKAVADVPSVEDLVKRTGVPLAPAKATNGQ